MHPIGTVLAINLRIFSYLPFGRRMSEILARTPTGASSTVFEFQAFFRRTPYSIIRSTFADRAHQADIFIRFQREIGYFPNIAFRSISYNSVSRHPANSTPIFEISFSSYRIKSPRPHCACANAVKCVSINIYRISY